MPYSEELEARIERLVEPWKGTDRKRMFGGICHLLQENMFCGVYKEYLKPGFENHGRMRRERSSGERG